MRGRVVLGLLLVLAGAGLMLDRLQLIGFAAVAATWWPTVLVALGLYQLALGEGRVGPTILVGAGGLILADNLGVFEGTWTRFVWPAVLLLAGLWLVLGARGRRGAGRPCDDRAGVPDGRIERTALFAGLEMRPRIEGFERGELTAVFGGLKIDLRGVDLAPEGAVLEATALFGGIEITVPEGWEVHVDGTPVFGGIEADLRRTAPGGPSLTVHATAIFGGVTIKDAPGDGPPTTVEEDVGGEPAPG